MKWRDGVSEAVWVKCELCENFLCTLHEMHVHDCPCPPIEDWVGSHDPYGV